MKRFTLSLFATVCVSQEEPEVNPLLDELNKLGEGFDSVVDWFYDDPDADLTVLDGVNTETRVIAVRRDGQLCTII